MVRVHTVIERADPDTGPPDELVHARIHQHPVQWL